MLFAFTYTSITFENILLLGSILLFVSVLVGKTGYKIGMPVLLLFLGVGMVCGSNGIGIEFQDYKLTQFIGMLALSVILFSGGMSTRYSDIKPIYVQGLILSTFAVFATAIFIGVFVYYISKLIGGVFELTFYQSLLLGSIISSTDSASVFSILRSKGVNISRKLRATLEFESGSNDPMAYMLTIMLIGMIGDSDSSVSKYITTFLVQMSLGALLGYVIAKIAVYTINKINIDNDALYSVLLLSFVFFTFAFTDMIHGNGYLAVYIAGLIVGNNRLAHKKSLETFFECFTWLWQITMFLTLGLLVNPTELMPLALISFLIALFMIIFGRPISVFLSLIFFKMPFKERVYISWVGLRGAVPIIFATYPVMADTPGAKMIFNIVFFITIISLLVQGTTVAYAAKLLGLVSKEKEKKNTFGVELHENIKSVTSEIEIVESMLSNGNMLKDIRLPKNTLVVLVKREEHFFVPQGGTELHISDKVLLISDNEDELKKVYEQLGIDDYEIGKNL